MPQVPAVAAPPQEAIASQLDALRAKADELKLRVSDLSHRKSQLTDASTRRNAFLDRPALDKQVADVQHELAAAQIQLESTNQRIGDLEQQRDMARAFSLGGPPAIAMTVPPAPDPFLGPREIMTVLSGGFILVLPFVLVLARRLWIRSVPRPAANLEDSPRLQRIEQAIESIAVEVERIGEAQRFTTKLLADRHTDAAARIGVVPRREPGTITPH
jgi:hypothetical protein